jgi:hypothetical protein
MKQYPFSFELFITKTSQGTISSFFIFIIFPTSILLHLASMKFGDLYNKVFELFASLSFLCFLISSYASFNKFILVHKTNGII